MRKTIVAIALGLFCGAVSAVEPAGALAKIDANGTLYISGGIGEEELEQIARESGEFNLKLILAEKTGTYVSDVQVVVFGANSSKVLEVSGAGPLVFARLPAGHYLVSATYGGMEKRAQVDVGAKGRKQVVFGW